MTVGLLGVRLRLHPSWLLIFGLTAFSLALIGLPPEVASDDPLRWVLGLNVASLFFLSVVAHELSHALVARRQGAAVAEVNVLVLGGNASLDREAPDARSEAIIAITGPIISLLLAGIFLGLWLLTRELATTLGLLFSATVLWTGLGNLLLGVFNLLPGFPMDGGRLLRALLWGLTGDFLRATRLASYAGRLFAYGLLASGLVVAFVAELVMGVWLVVMGWFLNRATEMAYRRVELGMLIENLAVRDVMEQDVAVVGPNLTLDTLVEQHAMRGSSALYPVTMGGELVGTVDMRQVKRVPRGQWAQTRVTDVMSRGDRLLTLTEPLSLMDAMLRLEQSGSAGLPVVAEDQPQRLLGMVTREGLARVIRQRAALHQAGVSR